MTKTKRFEFQKQKITTTTNNQTIKQINNYKIKEQNDHNCSVLGGIDNLWNIELKQAHPHTKRINILYMYNSKYVKMRAANQYFFFSFDSYAGNHTGKKPQRKQQVQGLSDLSVRVRHTHKARNPM